MHHAPPQNSHQLIRIQAFHATVVQTVLRTGRTVQVQDYVQTSIPRRKTREKKDRKEKRNTERDKIGSSLFVTHHEIKWV